MHFAGLSCDGYEADPGNERAVNDALEQTITGAVPKTSSTHTCRAASSSSSISRRELSTSDEIAISMSLTVRDAAFGGTTSKTNITNQAQKSLAESAASGALITAILENAPSGSSLLFASVYPHAPPTSLPTASPTGNRLDLYDSFGIPHNWESFANTFLAFSTLFTFGFATFVFASKKESSNGSSSAEGDSPSRNSTRRASNTQPVSTGSDKGVKERLLLCVKAAPAAIQKVAVVAFPAVKEYYAEILTITFATMDLISDFLFAVQCIYWSREPNLESDEEDYISPSMGTVGFLALGWVLVCVIMNATFIWRLHDKWDQATMDKEGMYKYGAVVLLMGFGLDAMTMLPWKKKRANDSYPTEGGVFYSLVSKLVEDIPQFIFQGTAMAILSSNPITEAHAFSSVSATCLITSIISFAHAALTKCLMISGGNNKVEPAGVVQVQTAQPANVPIVQPQAFVASSSSSA